VSCSRPARYGEGSVPAPTPWWSITLDRYPLLRGTLLQHRFELRRCLLPLLLPPASPEIEAESVADVAALIVVAARERRWQPPLDGYFASLEAAPA
jgi:hypothetical protein